MNEKILDRIAALLNLADGNANENEAAAAMAAAQRLMAQHNIDRASVDSHAEAEDMAEDTTIADSILDAGLGLQLPMWRWWLAQGIAKVNGAHCYISKYYREGKQCTRIMILGTVNDAGATRYLYTYAAKQVEDLCRAALRENGNPGKTWGTNFRQACALRVVERYRAAAKVNNTEVRATATGATLVRVDAHAEAKALALRSTIERKGFRSAGTYQGSKYDPHAREAGRAAGDKVNLGHGSTRGALSAPAKSLKQPV